MTLSTFKAFNFRVARRLLHAWIRPRIINADYAKLGIQDDAEICYVLPQRSLADLLVVDHACEENGMHLPHLPVGDRETDEARSFFFLAHAEGRLLKRRSHRVHSERMVRLLDAHALDPARNLQLIPVSLFWGHAPEREKSIFKLILSDTWTATNRLKKFLALLFQPNHIVVQFSTPISLRDIVDGEPDARLRARKLARLLRVHFRARKQAIIGPDLSHRRTMVGAIISSSAVQQAIAADAEIRQIAPAKSEATARRYANEIAAHQSYRVIHFLYRILTWFWNRIYDGFVVHRIELAQELAQDHEVVYAPSHRSHIDYLILSYLLYQNGLSPPHIAAGKNMNIPLIGPLLRRGGAFFMRRTFQDDELYKAVFDEYMYMTFSKGYSVEYFIEGGRSRTGRMLDPRMGLIGMTVRSFQRKPSPPLVFMPVYFGYEKVLEAATYVGELRGAEKREESIMDVVRALKLLKFGFGKVHVNFGEPLLLDQFLDEHLPDWRTPEAVPRDALFAACEQLGGELVERINRAAAVTPINLLAVTLLATSTQRIAERTLCTQLDRLRRVLEETRYDDAVTITDLPAKEIVELGERLSMVARLDEPFADVLSTEHDLTVLLTYYRNNVAHLLALPSLVARIVATHQPIPVSDLLARCGELYPSLASEYHLPWQEAEARSICENHVGRLAALGLLDTRGDELHAPSMGTEECTALLLLGEVVEPTLQRFFIAGGLIEAMQGAPVQQSVLEEACRHVAQTIAAIYRFNAPEFFEGSLFTRFLNGMVARGAIAREENLLTGRRELSELLATIAPMIDADVHQGIRESINEFARPEADGSEHTRRSGSASP